MKKQASHSHYILIGITTITCALVIGLALFALATFVSYYNSLGKRQTPQDYSAAKTSSLFRASHRPLSPKPTPTIPDVHIPPIIDGLVPVITSLPTTQPVVFLGIDDGAHKTPDELQTMQANRVKASLFLSRLFIDDNPGFFTNYQKAGNIIENHSLDHLTDRVSIESYEVQKAQICGMAEYELQHYGKRPVFFRPPGGEYSTAMRRAAADCGMKAIVTWIAKANGGAMQYQIGDHLRPGDVVLMHFRPKFQQDMRAFLDAMNKQHLRTALLEDWLP